MTIFETENKFLFKISLMASDWCNCSHCSIVLIVFHCVFHVGTSLRSVNNSWSSGACYESDFPTRCGHILLFIWKTDRILISASGQSIARGREWRLLSRTCTGAGRNTQRRAVMKSLKKVTELPARHVWNPLSARNWKNEILLCLNVQKWHKFKCTRLQSHDAEDPCPYVMSLYVASK